MGTSIAQSERLTVAEFDRLRMLEDAIDIGMKTFVTVGKSLVEIRDGRLYRASFETFEDYCQDRWGMTRQHANRLIQSAEVVTNVEPMGSTPESERQARPLAKLPAEEQPAAWKEAVETAPEGKVTAKHVEAVVAKRTSRVIQNGNSKYIIEDDEEADPQIHAQHPVIPPDSPLINSKGMALAAEAINTLKRIPINDPNRLNGLKTVAKWIRDNQ